MESHTGDRKSSEHDSKEGSTEDEYRRLSDNKSERRKDPQDCKERSIKDDVVEDLEERLFDNWDNFIEHLENRTLENKSERRKDSQDCKERSIKDDVVEDLGERLFDNWDDFIEHLENRTLGNKSERHKDPQDCKESSIKDDVVEDLGERLLDNKRERRKDLHDRKENSMDDDVLQDLGERLFDNWDDFIEDVENRILENKNERCQDPQDCKEGSIKDDVVEDLGECLLPGKYNCDDKGESFQKLRSKDSQKVREPCDHRETQVEEICEHEMRMEESLLEVDREMIKKENSCRMELESRKNKKANKKPFQSLENILNRSIELLNEINLEPCEDACSKLAEEEKIKEKKPELSAYLSAMQSLQYRGCRNVREYQILNKISEGSFGIVYRGRDRHTKEIVALKQLKLEGEEQGFPITSLREIKILKKLSHSNIVSIREIVVGDNFMGNIFIVMDYVENDLKSIMDSLKHNQYGFALGEVKCLMQQLLCAVAHLHDNGILHRDLKASNLLLSHKGILKVCDFGLARECGLKSKKYSPRIGTRWYNAPEVLLRVSNYCTPIDMWSVGCIFAEFLKMKPLFPGESDIDQLKKIFKSLGTPNEQIWPGYNKLPMVQKLSFAHYPVNNLRQIFSLLSDLGIELLNKFLTYDPQQRITAKDALNHGYFTEAPLPIDPQMFSWLAKSEHGEKINASPNRSSDVPKSLKENKQVCGVDTELSDSLVNMGLMEDDSPVVGGFRIT